MIAHDLLIDPLISVRVATDRLAYTLPEVLAALQRDAVEDFPALQPHQQHAWYAFLVQLAALVEHAEGGLPADVSGWHDALRRLGQVPSAWCLIVTNRTLPGFMQPPVGKAKLGGAEAHPDGLDVLVTSKNHDLKRARIQHAALEHWLFALVTLQTMQGFLGRGNYGIARMNGGFGNRPCVGRAPSPRWGQRWARDVAALSEQRAALIEHYGFSTKGHALLWLPSWAGTESIALKDCDPFVIEVCRRVRLEQTDAGVLAACGPSEAARLSAKDMLGLVGDPWTPYGNEKSLTLNADGFSYKRLHQLLFEGEINPSPAMAPREADAATMFLRCWAMVRGQGQTEGVHQRWLELPEHVELSFSSLGGVESLGDVSKIRIGQAKRARVNMLRPALMTLLKPGSKPNDNRLFLQAQEARLEAWIDRAFFPALWRDFEVDEDTRDDPWITALCAQARETLEHAIASTPLPAVHRYARIAAAEGMFYGCRKKQFPQVFDRKKGAA